MGPHETTETILRTSIERTQAQALHQRRTQVQRRAHEIAGMIELARLLDVSPALPRVLSAHLKELRRDLRRSPTSATPADGRTRTARASTARRR